MQRWHARQWQRVPTWSMMCQEDSWILTCMLRSDPRCCPQALASLQVRNTFQRGHVFLLTGCNLHSHWVLHFHIWPTIQQLHPCDDAHFATGYRLHHLSHYLSCSLTMQYKGRDCAKAFAVVLHCGFHKTHARLMQVCLDDLCLSLAADCSPQPALTPSCTYLSTQQLTHQNIHTQHQM